MRALVRVTLGLVASLALSACDAPGALRPRALRAEFGVLYGGQVQEREELPFELDPSRQRIGFRVTLTPAPEDALEVRWELGRPGTGRRVADSHGRKARPRQVQLGRAHYRSGETTFEQALAFSPGDPLGLWNIRVQLGSEVVIDRSFLVYDPVERARRRDAFERSDAGL
jgi:hypothetical protein